MRQLISYFTGLCALVAGSACLIGCGADVSDSLEDEGIGEAEEALPGTTEPGSNQILTCVDSDYWGYCALMGTGFWPQTVGVWNDSLTSFKVGSNVRVTFFSDVGFAGSYGTFDPNARITNLWGRAPGNDTATSMRVVSSSTPDCRSGNPPAGWVYLYRDANYSGDCVALSRGDYFNSNAFGLQNDSLSSMKIGTSLSRVMLFSDVNRGGATTNYNTGGALTLVPVVYGNDTMSSLKVE